MTEVSEEALAKMHDDMIDIAAAADFVRGRIRTGHNGEGWALPKETPKPVQIEMFGG